MFAISTWNKCKLSLLDGYFLIFYSYSIFFAECNVLLFKKMKPFWFGFRIQSMEAAFNDQFCRGKWYCKGIYMFRHWTLLCTTLFQSNFRRENYYPYTNDKCYPVFTGNFGPFKITRTKLPGYLAYFLMMYIYFTVFFIIELISREVK
jgi:hypothetical protein